MVCVLLKYKSLKKGGRGPGWGREPWDLLGGYLYIPGTVLDALRTALRDRGQYCHGSGQVQVLSI